LDTKWTTPAVCYKEHWTATIFYSMNFDWQWCVSMPHLLKKCTTLSGYAWWAKLCMCGQCGNGNYLISSHFSWEFKTALRQWSDSRGKSTCLSSLKS
jgi:hypothetical protein